MTWVQDDSLIASYADGFGFEPMVSNKLSLGLATIEGSPPNNSGINLRSPSGEQIGDGSSGKKASGMLMVEGILYMWVRNADLNGNECQLAVSSDNGSTWSWSNWKFQEFGYCTFLNFGKNYSGARDQFVYMYSHNDRSAYVAADTMILARVPKASINDRQSYEFFAGLAQNGDPQWSTSIGNRAPVFEHSGLSLRSEVTYNSGIDRYIWWQQIPKNGADTRFQGGFGVYDAPTPWGPWTTVYFTEDWDVGPGESGRFPTKWMSADGKTMHLVFSGDDFFSVRRIELTIGEAVSSAPNSPEDLVAL